MGNDLVAPIGVVAWSVHAPHVVYPLRAFVTKESNDGVLLVISLEPTLVAFEPAL
jgi:hypothetical protein